MKILLVDDDPFVLNLLSIQIRALGPAYEVTCRTSGQAALGLLDHGNEVDVVFCDLQMPEMDGVEFVRHLVRVGYAGSLVLVSGENARTREAVEQLARAHGLRVLGTLGKPVTTDSLLRLLGTAMPSAAPSGPDIQAPLYTASDLELAIERGELRNHYQPKVDPASGKVAGFEVLVRWQHPRDGLVPPSLFVPMSEECGLVGRVGAEVMRRALCDLGRWLGAGYQLDLAVNVSLASVLSLDYPDFLVGQARAAGVPLRHLVLEITESRLMDNPQVQLDVLTRLRLKGVKLSIDDFGTGYSSLAQLRDLPFDELKIDRGFVHKATHAPALRAILDASLSLARELGLRTVAEGVEDREDWELLRTAGCDLVQGYFIAKPMPGNEVEDWLAAWEHRRKNLVVGGPAGDF